MNVLLSEGTNTIGIFFRFDEAETNGIAIREYGFLGGDVEYVASVSGDLAMGGVVTAFDGSGETAFDSDNVFSRMTLAGEMNRLSWLPVNGANGYPIY